jgi:hypothetical protein
MSHILTGHRFRQQEAVLTRDRSRNLLSPHTVPAALERHHTADVDSQRLVNPAGQPFDSGTRQDMTARQHGNAGPDPDGTIQHRVGQASACVARYDHVFFSERDRSQVRLDELHTTLKRRPGRRQRSVQGRMRSRQGTVHNDGVGRRPIEEQQHVRQQPVTACDVDHASTPEPAPDTSRNFPRLVQFLSRQTTRRADDTANPIEQPLARETPEIVNGDTRP